MKTIRFTYLLIALAFACNTAEKTENTSSNDMKESATTEASASVDVYEAYVAIDSDEALIATALMAAPAESREDCTVIGYNMAGEFVTLKEGSNEFICLADDPKRKGFNAACYHKELDPFMARGRELRAEGKTGPEIFNIREEEVKSGQLSMGTPGTTLHIYYGENATYDPESGKVAGAKHRYVVYLPFATAESTGLPERPQSSNHPWIMNPGTHRAHIMITPIKE